MNTNQIQFGLFAFIGGWLSYFGILLIEPSLRSGLQKNYFLAFTSSLCLAASFGYCGSVMLTGSRISSISFSVSSFLARAMSMI
jgi:hypothetical protein